MKRFFTLTILLLGLMFSSLAGARPPLSLHSSDEVFPSLTIQGNDFESACSKEEWRKIHSSILQLMPIQKSTELIAVIHVYLCGLGQSSNLKLQKHLPKVIPFTKDDGDEEFKENISSSQISTLSGKAWDLQIVKKSKNIDLLYFSNEYCVRSISFAFIKNNWLLASIGESCD